MICTSPNPGALFATMWATSWAFGRATSRPATTIRVRFLRQVSPRHAAPLRHAVRRCSHVGAYLQEGTWKAPDQVDESKPISAAKCAFADGNHYYIEFADYLRTDHAEPADIRNKLASSGAGAWAYVATTAGGASISGPNDLAVGDWFAYPLSSCASETSPAGVWRRRRRRRRRRRCRRHRRGSHRWPSLPMLLRGTGGIPSHEV